MPNYGINQGMHAGYLAEFIGGRCNMHNDLFVSLIQDINDTYISIFSMHLFPPLRWIAVFL